MIKNILTASIRLQFQTDVVIGLVEVFPTSAYVHQFLFAGLIGFAAYSFLITSLGHYQHLDLGTGAETFTAFAEIMSAIVIFLDYCF
jgi:hypothetical protein